MRRSCIGCGRQLAFGVSSGTVKPFRSSVLSRSLRPAKSLFAEHGFGLWGVRRTGDPRLVGFGGFWYFREPPELELLYGIAKEVWGRGYATAVVGAVVTYGFGTLRMPIIRASTDAGNVGSVRVLEKLGFQLTNRATVAGLDTLFYERSGRAD